MFNSGKQFDCTLNILHNVQSSLTFSVTVTLCQSN